jgi:hypothetical protein
MRDPVDLEMKKETLKRQTITDSSALAADNMLQGVTLDSLKPVPRKYSKAAHPFDGYPLKYGTMNGQRVCLTFLVVFNNAKEVFQDPANAKHSIIQKDGSEKIITLKTVPNRVVVDYESGGVNTIVIFDREYTLEDGKTVRYAAVVPSHSCRAQLCFKVDPKNMAISPNEDYFLFDPEQSARLRRVMDNILKPKRKAERDAQAISGESQETLDNIPVEAGQEE